MNSTTSKEWLEADGLGGFASGTDHGILTRRYHQGTVWPWLIGAFVEAWIRVRGNSNAAKAEARKRFFAPLLSHLNEFGLGHISEIADANAPHAPRGCPFQAWSVGELLRLERSVLAKGPVPVARKIRTAARLQSVPGA
jgi:glycogen debranching enzyme